MNVKLKTALQLGTLFTIAIATLVCFALTLIMTGHLDAASAWDATRFVAVFLGIMALLMAYALHAIGSSLSQRVDRLEKGARRVRAGSLDETVAVDGHDEVANISSVFNEMTADLREYVRLIPVHEKIKQQVEELTHAVQDLRTRNMEVSDSLQRLRRAQTQLLDRERVNVLGRMFGGLAGHLNDALTAILAAARSVPADSALAPAAREAAERIAAAAQESQGRIERFVELQRAAEDRNPQRADLRGIVSDAVALTEPQWQRQTGSREAAVGIDNGIPAGLMVTGNRWDLVQLFVNLILNSVEAMPGGGRIVISVPRSNKDAVTIAFSDNGPGMPAGVLHRCFRPFFSTKEGAAGIGLTIAESIATEHGGRIGIESEVGSGTVVFIELPTAGQAAAGRGEAASLKHRRSLNILFVEDDPWTRDIVAHNLSVDGHHVQTATNGADALAKIRGAAFHVLITDRAMPDMQGDDLAAQAKRERPELLVILLTGFGSLMREKGEKPPGVDLVVGKPVSMPDLQQALLSLVSD